MRELERRVENGNFPVRESETGNKFEVKIEDGRSGFELEMYRQAVDYDDIESRLEEIKEEEF